jgi:hypothetical protein
MRAPALSKSARSRVKTVTSSGFARVNSARLKRAADRSSVTASMGTRPRYSMRCATSAAVGAEIDPLTISPLWVSAR